MTRIFISYDRDDRNFTRQLASRLRRVFGQVWFDENLYGGEDWWNEIRRQIADCDIFIYLLTEASAQSEYCKAEHAEAERLRKEVLPVRLSTVNTIPSFLQKIQYVDMSDGGLTVENFTELTAAIKQISDKIAEDNVRLTYAETARRHRSTTLRWVTLLVVLAPLLLGGGVLLAAPRPPFSGQIAFMTGKPHNQDIYVVDGGVSWMIGRYLHNNTHRIASQADDSGIAWSPDGRRLLFSSQKDGNTDLYVVNADGSDEQRLTHTPDAREYEPTWSPDGRQIAYTADLGGGNTEIFVMDADGQNARNLTNTPGVAEKQPAWGPLDTGVIAFVSNKTRDWDVYTMNTDGSSVVNLTVRPDADDTMPAWSPDGTQIAFVSNRVRSPNLINAKGSEDVWIMGVDGSRLVQLTRSVGADIAPSWSPDGKQIVFASDRDGDADLYVVDSSDWRKVAAVTDDTDNNLFPVWRH
jgi:Tol biopolymer transport system component